MLVGHSYGGMLITEAGNAGNVAGLVYIAAFQPVARENLVDLAGKIPPATKGMTETSDGFLYLDPKVYAKDLAPAPALPGHVRAMLLTGECGFF